MNNGIIKADGTSRLMRAELPATYEEFRAQAAAGTLPMDILFNADGWTQLPTFLNKGALLKDLTAALYGLGSDAVPDEVLAFLGKYNQHWWRSTAKEIIGATYNISDVETDVMIGMENYIVTVQYSDAIDVSSGVVSLASPITSISVNAGDAVSLSQLDSIKGKFFRTSHNNSDAIYQRAQTDSYVSQNGKFIYGYASGKLVSYVPATSSVGDTNYLHSAHRNAYPDSGITSGIEYEYLGIPFENAVTAPKIELGSYNGTGTYGENNQNSLTFKFPPKLLIIIPSSADEGICEKILGLFVYNAPHVAMYFDGGSSGGSGKSNGNVYISGWDTNTIKWYNPGHASNQLNLSTHIYYYIAIGYGI